MAKIQIKLKPKLKGFSKILSLPFFLVSCEPSKRIIIWGLGLRTLSAWSLSVFATDLYTFLFLKNIDYPSDCGGVNQPEKKTYIKKN